MKIAFIGAGKVGFALGKYLQNCGATIAGYYSQNPQSAKDAANFTQSQAYDTIGELIDASSVLFFTVPDGKIQKLWHEVQHYSALQHKLLCHCSGALSSAVFDGATEQNISVCSLHPFCSVSDKLTSHTRLASATFTLETAEDTPVRSKYLTMLCDILQKAGNPLCFLHQEDKTRYHAAAVMASNHVVALAYISAGMLQQCNFPLDQSEKLVCSLMRGTLENITAQGTIHALTGPIERNDSATVQKHLTALSKKQREIYCTLSKELILLAEQKNTSNDYSKIKEILAR